MRSPKPIQLVQKHVYEVEDTYDNAFRIRPRTGRNPFAMASRESFHRNFGLTSQNVAGFPDVEALEQASVFENKQHFLTSLTYLVSCNCCHKRSIRTESATGNRTFWCKYDGRWVHAISKAILDIQIRLKRTYTSFVGRYSSSKSIWLRLDGKQPKCSSCNQRIPRFLDPHRTPGRLQQFQSQRPKKVYRFLAYVSTLRGNARWLPGLTIDK